MTNPTSPPAPGGAPPDRGPFSAPGPMPAAPVPGALPEALPMRATSPNATSVFGTSGVRS
jgi:hypothetical protein